MTRASPNSRERERWILAQRPPRNIVDPRRPYAFLIEQERAAAGDIATVATIFLTNRECPWRCLMCDLWRNTLPKTVPPGAIPAQIDYALAQLLPGRTGVSPVPKMPSESTSDVASTSASNSRGERDRRDTSPAFPRQVKLYNSGSFFDPQAIPVADYPTIAVRVRSFERVIVECHPALVGERCLRFRDLLVGHAASVPSAFQPPLQLEVAMGLETVHPEVLEKLNKRMTLEQFARAAEFLRANEIALRTFILVKPPFLDEAAGLYWAERSIDFAFDCGATVVSLIPTRFGNGALEALAERGEFAAPKLATLEAAAAYGIGLNRRRVFADLWDLEKFSDCQDCFPQRHRRLREMNLRQVALPPVRCQSCEGSR